jgi:hypothetical protein
LRASPQRVLVIAVTKGGAKAILELNRGPPAEPTVAPKIRESHGYLIGLRYHIGGDAGFDTLHLLVGNLPNTQGPVQADK